MFFQVDILWYLPIPGPGDSRVIPVTNAREGRHFGGERNTDVNKPLSIPPPGILSTGVGDSVLDFKDTVSSGCGGNRLKKQITANGRQYYFYDTLFPCGKLINDTFFTIIQSLSRKIHRFYTKKTSIFLFFFVK